MISWQHFVHPSCATAIWSILSWFPDTLHKLIQHHSYGISSNQHSWHSMIRETNEHCKMTWILTIHFKFVSNWITENKNDTHCKILSLCWQNKQATYMRILLHCYLQSFIGRADMFIIRISLFFFCSHHKYAILLSHCIQSGSPIW